MKKQLNLPKFQNENEERKYWQSIDVAEHFESSDFDKVSMPNLVATSEPISIRMPKHMLMRVKVKANEILVPYQALIKMYIQKGLKDSSSQTADRV